MGIVSVSLPADGSTADVADYNTPITTIVTAINGNLDSTNISSLNGSDLVAASVPGSSLDTNLAGGWLAGALAAPNTVTCNGNRSYSLVFNSVNYTTTLSPGMRLRSTRTVAAPTQCTSLNGTTQYYSKTSPAGMTFTDDFVVSAWVKASSYAAAQADIVTRNNGTSGWNLRMDATGQIMLFGNNGAGANFSQVKSYQSIPLNKWVHITAQLDMSTFTATTTTSYIMIDGVDVPAAVSRGGTNPTALVQAGNLEIGSGNGGLLPFPGKIAQAAIFNAKVTQATIQGYISQGLAGTETSLISAYSFNNSINDLNANANNLTAQGSAVATNADSPFGGQADGTISSTLDYAIIQSVSFSTNTTVVVQVAEGCTMPTSGGISAVSYSTQKVPYGLPAQTKKWSVAALFKADFIQSAAVSGTWYNMTTASGSTGGVTIKLPIGEWNTRYECNVFETQSGANQPSMYTTLSSANNTESDSTTTSHYYIGSNTVNMAMAGTHRTTHSLAAATNYYLNVKADTTNTNINLRGSTDAPFFIEAENAFL